MPNVLKYLDCGCAIMVDGSRAWCPSCLEPSKYKNPKKTDITEEITHSWPDDRLLPINECLCGAQFQPWEFTIDDDYDEPCQCPHCGRRFIWEVRVFEIK